jgi:hypothetical protein
MEWFEMEDLHEIVLFDKIVDGYRVEIVESDGRILAYVDGFFEGEMWESDSFEEYVEQLDL